MLGRKPTAVDGTSALKIEDPTRTMSKTHARMRRVGDGWTIEDLHSTNGVAVFDDLGNSTQVESGRETEVSERLIIGTLEVRLRPMN
nr:FHA domain-containing protein [Leucobacter coleopterorum]